MDQFTGWSDPKTDVCLVLRRGGFQNDRTGTRVRLPSNSPVKTPRPPDTVPTGNKPQNRTKRRVIPTKRLHLILPKLQKNVIVSLFCFVFTSSTTDIIRDSKTGPFFFLVKKKELWILRVPFVSSDEI